VFGGAFVNAVATKFVCFFSSILAHHTGE